MPTVPIRPPRDGSTAGYEAVPLILGPSGRNRLTDDAPPAGARNGRGTAEPQRRAGGTARRPAPLSADRERKGGRRGGERKGGRGKREKRGRGGEEGWWVAGPGAEWTARSWTTARATRPALPQPWRARPRCRGRTADEGMVVSAGWVAGARLRTGHTSAAVPRRKLTNHHQGSGRQGLARIAPGRGQGACHVVVTLCSVLPFMRGGSAEGLDRLVVGPGGAVAGDLRRAAVVGADPFEIRVKGAVQT